MISSAIWDKSAEVNFSKTNKIARARREIAICGLWKIYSADLSQSAREKSCDYLIIIYMQKFDLRISSFTCHLAPFVKAPSSCLQMKTSIEIGQNFDRWILVDKNAAARNLFIENCNLLSYILNCSCFSTAAVERNTTSNKIGDRPHAGRRAASFFLSNNRLWQNDPLLGGWPTRRWRLHALYFRWYQAVFSRRCSPPNKHYTTTANRKGWWIWVFFVLVVVVRG